MTKDRTLVERLRSFAGTGKLLTQEAADEIERLQREHQRMNDVHCHLLVFLRSDLAKVAEKYENLSEGSIPKSFAVEPSGEYQGSTTDSEDVPR